MHGLGRSEETIRYEMVDFADIQKIQDCFCKVTNTFVYAVDQDGNKITEVSGKQEEADRIMDAVGSSAFYSLFTRLKESSLEDQIVEDTEYANIKLGAVAIKKEGKPMICWLACCVLSEEDVVSDGRILRDITTCTGVKEFQRALDLINVVMLRGKTFYNQMDVIREASRRNRMHEKELESAKSRAEAMAQVVRTLGSGQSFSKNTDNILEIMGRYLAVSAVQLVKPLEHVERINVLNEWIASDVDFVGNMQFKADMDMPLVFTMGMIMPETVKAYLEQNAIQALIVFPVVGETDTKMYLIVADTRKREKWLAEEVAFVEDVVKVLQSLLIRKLQEQSLSDSHEALQSILDNAGTGIYVQDVETREVLFINKLMQSTFEQDIVFGTIDSLLERTRPLLENEGYYEIYHQTGKHWYDVYYTNIIWVDGRKATLYALYDITDKKLYQKRIEHQAYTDFLTGLYNRMCCERDLAAQIDKAKLTNTKGGLLYLDLDDFKNINDGLGHQYGDALLKSISCCMKQVSGIENSCYRMGGDEFVIIVPPENFNRFRQIMDEIKDVFSKPWFLKDADYYCTMSMGACVFPDNGDTVQDLIRKADLAMYEAKKSGKNKITVYSGNISEETNKRLDMEKNMRRASNYDCQEFEVYFQPIIDIQKKNQPCTGAEALVRWNSESLGFISPADFIPLAEYLGLINPIGNHVLREACRACNYWNENGHPEYKVNVNLSVVQLLQPDIVEIVSQIVTETGVNPRNLTLEVTESLAINDMERMKKILGEIRALGVRIALDDFGTGYSSLNHIREIPLDVIKVDQSFVVDLTEDEYSQSFIKMVAELADAIDVSICVEGIETEAQYKVLEGMKVCIVQGYYFDRPMPREAFERKYL